METTSVRLPVPGHDGDLAVVRYGSWGRPVLLFPSEGGSARDAEHNGMLDAVRPRWLNYRFGLLNRDLAERVHSDGLLVSAWTADTRRTMRRLIACGVDSITTNRIDALRKQLANSSSYGPS